MSHLVVSGSACQPGACNARQTGYGVLSTTPIYSTPGFVHTGQVTFRGFTWQPANFTIRQLGDSYVHILRTIQMYNPDCPLHVHDVKYCTVSRAPVSCMRINRTIVALGSPVSTGRTPGLSIYAGNPVCRDCVHAPCRPHFGIEIAPPHTLPSTIRQLCVRGFSITM